MYLLLGLVIVVGAAVLTLYPLFKQPDEETADDRGFVGEAEEDLVPGEALALKKERVFASLSDLEYDHALNKIDEDDYLQMKESLTEEAMAILKEEESLAGRRTPSSDRGKDGRDEDLEGDWEGEEAEVDGDLDAELDALIEAEIATMVAEESAKKVGAAAAEPVIRYCPACGAKLLTSTQKFCHACGTPTDPVAASDKKKSRRRDGKER